MTIRHQRAWDYMRHYLGLQINLMRLARGWNVERLAKESGVSARVIRALENGKVDAATILTLTRLAKAFDVAAFVHMESFGKSLVAHYGLDATRNFEERKEA